MRKQLRWMTCGLLVAGTLANATCAAPGPRGSGQREIARPRLVVFIVVDQLPSWSFAQRVPYFSHGYARLLREGTYVPRVELPTALPFTAPGHATLATGVVAAEHGIVGNSWFRREVGMEQPAEWDPAASVLRTDGGGPTPDVASGAALQVAGVGDWLRAQRPGAHALAIGLKSRAACFVAGQAPELAIFFEPEAGGMTSRELLEILRGFRGLNLVGADVVEVAPAYDHAEITGVAASHVAYDLVSLLALGPDA